MKLKDWIRKEGITVERFAAMVICSRGYLHEIMAERKSPKPPLSKRIIVATRGEVGWEDLYGDPLEEIPAASLNIKEGSQRPTL